ncbi:MAG: hypothetical protein JO146_08745 [Candidatus Eremiobacteraeota bacterium]|nr:hypothetical protein [Candidatus Eremiobacteraeota bacterium]
MSASGRLVAKAGPIPLAPSGPHRGSLKGRGDLFVTLDTTSAAGVDVLRNKTWKEVGAFTASGMSCLSADWIDNKGNLYVADYEEDYTCSGPNTPGIYEFPRGSSTPSFVYATGLIDPINLTTDRQGNVYVTDFLGGELDEYPQDSNTLSHQCAPPSGDGSVEGVAVDGHGDVFMVSGTSHSPWNAYLYEYVGGLNGCSATLLATFPFFQGGMALDKRQNLLLVDQTDNAVDVIPPPYTAIASQISAYQAFTVTINKQNSQIYIAAYPFVGYLTGAGAVYIDSYPSGSNIATLVPSDGVINPSGAVDTLNYVP